mmetsp:Transcript_21547/g.63596  ORF Transcript_21547/g.63596 Transcript_21547/m.63596 type:complete len:325 (-) Transcript_21547:621-1595(-)
MALSSRLTRRSRSSTGPRSASAPPPARTRSSSDPIRQQLLPKKRRGPRSFAASRSGNTRSSARSASALTASARTANARTASARTARRVNVLTGSERTVRRANGPSASARRHPRPTPRIRTPTATGRTSTGRRAICTGPQRPRRLRARMELLPLRHPRAPTPPTCTAPPTTRLPTVRLTQARPTRAPCPPATTLRLACPSSTWGTARWSTAPRTRRTATPSLRATRPCSRRALWPPCAIRSSRSWRASVPRATRPGPGRPPASSLTATTTCPAAQATAQASAPGAAVACPRRATLCRPVAPARRLRAGRRSPSNSKTRWRRSCTS